MATPIEQRPPVEGPLPAGVGVPTTSAAYPPFVEHLDYRPPDAPPVGAQRVERRWLSRCLVLAVVSLALYLPLLGISQWVAAQVGAGFGGFLVAAAILTLLLTVVNVAFAVITRPRR